MSEILTVVMCGVSAGERSIYGIREFARLKEQWLRDVIGLKLPAGLPSYFDKGHGRIERKIYTLDTHIGWFEQKKEWKKLAAFGMVESIVTRKGKETREKRYFITSVTDVKSFADGVRNHWEKRK